MATLTSYLQLTKPELGDTIDPSIFSENFDIIDAEIIKTNNKIDEAEKKIGTSQTDIKNTKETVKKLTTSLTSCYKMDDRYIINVYGKNDLNAATGTIICNSQSTTANVPPETDGWGTIIPFITGGTKGIQIFMAWNGRKVYVRTLFGGSFSAWVQIC